MTGGPPFMFRCTQKNIFPTHPAKHTVSICVLPCTLPLCSGRQNFVPTLRFVLLHHYFVLHPNRATPTDRPASRLIPCGRGSAFAAVRPATGPGSADCHEKVYGRSLIQSLRDSFEPAPVDLPDHPFRVPALDVGHAVEARTGFLGE